MRGRKRWRTRPKNAVKRLHTLRRWLQRCWPTSEVARNRLCAQRCSPHRPWPSRVLYPPAPHRMRVRFCLLWGGAFCRLCCRLHHRLPPAVRCKRYADAADLVAMLAAAMAPGLPIHRSTFFADGAIGPGLPTNLL